MILIYYSYNSYIYIYKIHTHPVRNCSVRNLLESGIKSWTLWRRPSPTSIQCCKALERHSCKARMCKNASMHLVLQSTNWCCKALWTHRWLQSYRTVQKCCQSMGAAKHLRQGRCTCCKAECWVLQSTPWLHRATGKEFHLAPHGQFFSCKDWPQCQSLPSTLTVRAQEHWWSFIQHEWDVGCASHWQPVSIGPFGWGRPSMDPPGTVSMGC